MLGRVSGQLRGLASPTAVPCRHAGTSSSWSMSRLWNTMKKGLAAPQAHPAVPVKPAPAAPHAAGSPARSTAQPSSSNVLWEPAPKAWSPGALRRFEVETPMFRCSPQKLADLGRQVSGLPIDAAALQMKFSAKRPAKQLYQLLTQAEANAKLRERSPADYVIREAVVGRGKYMKRIDIKGRGRSGIISKPHAFMRFVLEIPDERKEIARLLRVRGVPREHKPAYIKLDY